MKVVHFAHDSDAWAEIPFEFPRGPYASQQEWADAFASAYAVGAENEEALRATLHRIASSLPLEPRPGLYEKFWWVRDLRHTGLIVNASVVPGELVPEDTPLVELIGAYDPDAVRPPTVDTLPSERYGRIGRVVGFLKEEDDVLLARLSAIGRIDGLVILLEGITSDLPAATLALDDFTALMDSVTVSESD